MAEKDLLEKTLEEHNDVFADIVNALGFGGEELVSPESLKPGPTASIYEPRTAGSGSSTGTL